MSDHKTDNRFLDRLADLHGIQHDYYDIWGRRIEAPPAVKKAVLKSLGVDAGNDAAVWSEILRGEEKSWMRLLPPVMVTRENAFPCVVPLVWPQSDLGRDLEWRLFAEDGREFGGSIQAGSLKTLGRRTVRGISFARVGLVIAENPGWGYHRLHIRSEGRNGEMPFIVAPEKCYEPPPLASGRRVWGLSVQLYGLKSERNWGIGDFTDLLNMIDLAGDLGADAVGLNPLHALFAHDAEHCSPYDPSHRRFLNPLYVDVEAVPEYAESESARALVAGAEFRRRLQELRDAELVDYSGVREVKMQVLEILYREFRRAHLGPSPGPRGASFREFQNRGGRSLHLFALFEALQEDLYRRDKNQWGRFNWPREFRDPDAQAVRAFAGNNRERVEFYQYLQWRAGHQLEACGNRSLQRGLGIGMYFDMALSVNASGAEAWEGGHAFVEGMSLGAPPDDFNYKGQDWGLPPMHPEILSGEAYASFAANLEFSMKLSGALRLDHVMGLMRLYWVPAGMSPADGIYVHYPFGDLLGIVALESRRNNCLVVGEDLGTVPDEVRRELHHAGVYSYRLLYFEKGWNGEFKRPWEFSSQALAAVSTHDLPTLPGFWSGRDLDWRARLAMFPDKEFQKRIWDERVKDRARLLAALRNENLLPEGVTGDPASVAEMDAAMVNAVHGYLARAAAKIVLVQLEDVFCRKEQSNLPGTVNQHPNWRRKIAVRLEEFRQRPELHDLARRMNAERPRA